MKKSFLLLFLSIFVFLLTACGEEAGKTERSGESKEPEAKVLTKEEFDRIFSDPKKYKGSKVDFYAKIFVEPEKDQDGTYIQAFANNNSEQNVIVGIENPSLDVATDDIIHVTGTIEDAFKGENAFGGTVTAPLIKADKIEKTDYQTVFAPSKKTINLNKVQNQHGFKLNVQKVELADSETRVYVKITNESKEKIYFYSYDAKLIANNQQLEETFNYEANYPEIQSDILPGASTEGIIVFPPIKNDAASFKLHFEGSSDNYDITFEPFVYEVSLK